MWKTLVVIFRAPISLIALLLMTLVWAPIIITLCILLFLWGVVTAPFEVGKAIITDNPNDARSHLHDVIHLPLSILSTLGEGYGGLWNWTKGGKG